ncbi:MAG: peptidylprolyl isomerase [Mycobacteriaceae bacterium]
MPTNEQRRETAKRRLERQLERRAERARRRRQLTVLFSAVGVVVLVGAVALVVVLTRGDNSSTTTAAGSSSATKSTTGAAPATAAPVPVPTARAKPLAATVSCTYKPTPDQPASKKNTVPTGTDISTQGTVAVTMTTSAGTIPLTLDRAKAPCTVHSLVNLVQQNYFNNTPCHRLTTEGIKVLQCGDPTGKGSGGPGYSFANEFPTDQLDAKDPAARKAAIYPRGTIAMANAGPDTNGSQFFLVYGDSPLPPQYTVFGTISEPGLKVLDAIAAKGIKKGSGQGQPGDGAPATPVTITTMTVKA